MIPTGRLVGVAAALLSVGAAAVWVPALGWLLLAADLLMLAVALVDGLANRGEVIATRSFKHLQSVGDRFEVEVVVHNAGRRALRLRVTDDAPGQATGLPARARVPVGAEARLSYRVQVDERGAHPFGLVVVRWTSPLGLFERQASLPIESTVQVYPKFGQLRSYGINALPDERRAPMRSRRRPGGESEFERLRPYVAGDAYRNIDWRATARRGDFITREYGQEANQNVVFLLDCGRAMSGRGEGVSTFDRALEAALMMGQVALRHGDRVGFVAFDSEVRVWLPPKGGARSGSRLIRATYDLTPSLEEPDYALAFRELSHRVCRRSLVVLLTTSLDEVSASAAESLARALAGRHLPVCVWLRNPQLDHLVAAPADGDFARYTRAAAAEVALERERSLAALRKRGVLTVDCHVEQLTTELIGTYLEVKARRLL